MGQLIDRSGGKPVPRMQAADKTGREHHRAIAMNGGITQISRDAIPSMLRLNALKVLRDFVERFVPTDPLPTVLGATNGMLEPVLIEVNILQGDGLRTDVAAAEGIVFVAANVQTLVGPNGDFDPAHSFAEVAGTIMNRGFVGDWHGQ